MMGSSYCKTKESMKSLFDPMLNFYSHQLPNNPGDESETLMFVIFPTMLPQQKPYKQGPLHTLPVHYCAAATSLKTHPKSERAPAVLVIEEMPVLHSQH